MPYVKIGCLFFKINVLCVFIFPVRLCMVGYHQVSGSRKGVHRGFGRRQAPREKIPPRRIPFTKESC